MVTPKEKKPWLRKGKIVWMALGLVSILVLIYGSFINEAKKAPDHTVYSINEKGLSLFYESLQEYGASIQIRTKPPRENPNEIHMIFTPDAHEEEWQALESWVLKGGILVYAADSKISEFDLFEFPDTVPLVAESNEFYTLYHYGLGQILHTQAVFFENEYLKTNRNEAYLVVSYMEAFHLPLYINEYFHGYSTVAESNMWQEAPLYMKVLLIQLIIVIICYISYAGKRFGAPQPYYEIEERIENEYIIALGRLFHHHSHWAYITDAYFQELIAQLAKISHQGVNYTATHALSTWQMLQLPQEITLKRILASKPENQKEMKAQIKMYQGLMDILDSYF